MTRKLLLFSLLAFISHVSLGQHSNQLSGTIRDTTFNSLVKNAVVAVLSQTDSVLIRFARTNADGFYSLQGHRSGQVRILWSCTQALRIMWQILK